MPKSFAGCLVPLRRFSFSTAHSAGAGQIFHRKLLACTSAFDAFFNSDFWCRIVCFGAPRIPQNRSKIHQKSIIKWYLKKSLSEAISALISDPRNLENVALALAPCTLWRYCVFDIFINFWWILASFWEPNRVKTFLKFYKKMIPFWNPFWIDFWKILGTKMAS